MSGHHHHHHGSGGHAHCGGAPPSFRRAFAIGIALNTAFVVAEASAGLLSGSMALLADAGHNLSDVLSLVVAWAASVLARRPPSLRFTYGLQGTSILAALFNAVFLLIIVGALSWEALERLMHPSPVATDTMMVVAAIGIAVNGATAWLFSSGRKRDINVRAAFVHMLADAAVSAGVVLAALLIFVSGWMWLDPLVSLAINAVIVWGTWSVLRDAAAMSVGAVPAAIEPESVRAFLRGLPGVAGIHDLHIWSMSTTDNALTAHLVMPHGHPGDGFLLRSADELARRFGIGHATLQIEVSEETTCPLAPDHVV